MQAACAISNPRTKALGVGTAQRARRRYGSWSCRRSLSACSRNKPFFYTLTPPKLGGRTRSMNFYSIRKRGFLRPLCLSVCRTDARAARHTGAGGDRVSGRNATTPMADYWILRQSRRARLDRSLDRRVAVGCASIPTAAIDASERVERTVDRPTSPAPTNRPPAAWQRRTHWFCSACAAALRSTRQGDSGVNSILDLRPGLAGASCCSF